MKKKLIKTLVSVITATTMLVGSSLTAFAAYNEVEDTTVPKVIQVADEDVIATSDPSQLYLTGSLMTIHDATGSPDPQLINNGDGTWNLIMYRGQEVSLGVNNPYTNYTRYIPDIESATNPIMPVWIEEAGEYYPTSYDGGALGMNCNFFNDEDGTLLTYFGQTDAYNQLIIEGLTEGSDVYDVMVTDSWYGYYDVYNGYTDQPIKIGNSVTLAVFVLPTQTGAQAPIYTIGEMVDYGLM